MITYYFSHGRIALKYGLRQLKFNPEDEILIPEFICDVVVASLNEIGLKYRYYHTNESLMPDWQNLENLINKNSRAVLMVHYFGQPQDVKLFQSFCKNNELILIEDNAHGHGGYFNGEFLGTFGDISISSPRKTINLYSGGLLMINQKSDFSFPELPDYKPSFTEIIKLRFLNSNPKLKDYLKKIFKTRPKFEDPHSFNEPQLSDLIIDKWSKRIIAEEDWEALRIRRVNKYKYWDSFVCENLLTPVFKDLISDANPWCFPAYANNQKEAIKWFKWGWENNVNIFSWPSLPKEIIDLDGVSFDRWKKLICFGID